MRSDLFVIGDRNSEMIDANPSFVHALVLDQLGESLIGRQSFGFAAGKIYGSLFDGGEFGHVRDVHVPWPAVDIFFSHPDFVERRVTNIAAGNQQRRPLLRITWIHYINLRAAIAITILAPRRMTAQVKNILWRRRDYSGEIELIHQSMQSFLVVKHREIPPLA